MRYISIILFILYSSLATASQVLVIVDGKPITSIDVNKRIEALQLVNPQVSPNEDMRRHILNNLISEELFDNEAKRLKISVTEDEIKKHFEEIAHDNSISGTMVEKLINNQSLHKQVQSQITWNKLVGAVLYSKVKVSNAEIREEQKVRKGEIKEVTFKQIIFDSFDIVKIEKLYQAQDCEHLDILAKESGFSKPSKNTLLLSELNYTLQSIIKAIPENKLSAVIDLSKYKQVIMVCNKIIINNPKNTQQIRSELSNRKVNAEAQKYLAELKKRTYIEYIN